GEVLEVVADLVGDSERFAVFAENVFYVPVRTGVERTQSQRHLERGRGLLAEDFQHLERRQRLRVSRPAQLRSLARAESAVAERGDVEHLRLDLGRGGA